MKTKQFRIGRLATLGQVSRIVGARAVIPSPLRIDYKTPLSTNYETNGSHIERWLDGVEARQDHDEMAIPSKPAQKTARAVEGPRAGAAGNQARVHGERRRGAELDRDL